jgi:DNA-binding transcriptional LysR family regulator
MASLHVVLAVAESCMAKALRKLAISHPVASKTISDLVGVKLFDRTSQGVEMTSYGAALLKCGVNVFDEMRQGLKRISLRPRVGRTGGCLFGNHECRHHAGDLGTPAAAAPTRAVASDPR